MVNLTGFTFAPAPPGASEKKKSLPGKIYYFLLYIQIFQLIMNLLLLN